MTKTFVILKNEDKVKTSEGWLPASQVVGTPWKQTVVATIEAKNRREAWKAYATNLSNLWDIDNRSLTAERHNHNKRRRVELLSVIEIERLS